MDDDRSRVWKIFWRTKPGGRVFALLATAFTALLIIVGMAFWLGEQARNNFVETIQIRDARAQAAALRNSLLASESSQRGYLLTGNPIYLAPYETARNETQKELVKLSTTLAQSPQRQKMMDRLRQTVGEILALSDRMLALKTEGKDNEALSLLRTNRGKAFMDEANVFLSAIVFDADEKLTISSGDQNLNATRLRMVTISAAILIVVLLAAAILIGRRYTREITQARSAVEKVNEELEKRVAQRTSELANSRDRAEVLLSEVNHRVSNSLSMVSALVRLQKSAVKDPGARRALEETEERISAIGLVHKHLYTSQDVREVAVDEYLTVLLDQIEKSMVSEGLESTITCDFSPLKMSTNQTVNLGVLVSEWVTNAFKYAYPQSRGPVRVFMRPVDDASVEVVVEDDGIGREANSAPKGTELAHASSLRSLRR